MVCPVADNDFADAVVVAARPKIDTQLGHATIRPRNGCAALATLSPPWPRPELESRLALLRCVCVCAPDPVVAVELGPATKDNAGVAAGLYVELVHLVLRGSGRSVGARRRQEGRRLEAGAPTAAASRRHKQQDAGSRQAAGSRTRAAGTLDRP